MRIIRIIAFPFAILYGFITWIRNILFDVGLLKSTKFDIPVIAVGNLSTGGTGKTPQIEYLIRLLKDSNDLAVLSRGYKRKTKGFVLADANANADKIGDEPFQYFKKFSDIIVAVDEQRVHGIQQLLKNDNSPNLVLLDDAYQHRKVKAGLYVLLTSYNDLYCNDFMLPTGNLREFKEGAKRAQIVVVTKCPRDLSEDDQREILQKLTLSDNQQLYFSTISYDDVITNGENEILVSELKVYKILLVTGIANPEPLKRFLASKEIEFNHLEFPDHHSFSETDLENIKKAYQEFSSEKKIILTTEKDFVRLNGELNISYLKIKTTFINRGDDFDKKIKGYVEQSTGNS